MLRFPHFLDNRLIDGGKVAGAIVRLEGLGQLKKENPMTSSGPMAIFNVMARVHIF
jgi:hypothetical protein